MKAGVSMARGNHRLRFARTALALLAVFLAHAGTVAAHHSAAMFDDQHRISLSGTVRVFQWTNPHCYLQLLVKNSKGQEEEWSLEMAGPMYLYNLGFRPSTLKAGDQLTVRIAPLRNGKKGGLLVEAVTAAGKKLGINKL
jgi:hypothetical protein